MINVCDFNGKCDRYFWVNADEIKFQKTVVENWKIDDVKKHLKSIGEKWIIKKD